MVSRSVVCKAEKNWFIGLSGPGVSTVQVAPAAWLMRVCENIGPWVSNPEATINPPVSAVLAEVVRAKIEAPTVVMCAFLRNRVR